jgi:hypothetical protein
MDGGPWISGWNRINIKIGETMHFTGRLGNTTDVRFETNADISILDSNSGSWINCGALQVQKA